MNFLVYNLKRKALLLFLFTLFVPLCFSCKKEVKESDEKGDENIVPEKVDEIIIKDGDPLQLSIISEMSTDTKAHWNDANGTGAAQFEWDETTDDNADMVVCANKNSSYGNALSFWNVSNGVGEYTAKAKVKPDASNSKLASITTLTRLRFESNVGQRIYCVAPINNTNGSSVNRSYSSSEVTANLLMPSTFINSGSQNLKNFKDYSYIYAETVIDKVVKANNAYGVLGTCKASFKAVPVILRLSVTNKMTESVTIEKVVAKALKNNKEEKLFPDKLVYKVDGSGISIKESTESSASDSYYSALVADLSSSKQEISVNGNGLYYLFAMPRDVKDSYKGVELEFTVWATIGGVAKSFVIRKGVDSFNSGSIYTFELELNSTNISADGNRYADGEVSIMQRSTHSKYSRIIITGDGYNAEDLKRGGTFEKDVKDALEAIFSIEPFASYRDYFQVYCLYAESEERGSSGYTTYKSYSSERKKTKYGVKYDSPSNSSMTFDQNAGLEFFKRVPGYSFDERPNTTSVLILVNHGRYAGTCLSWSHAFSVSLCPMNRDGNDKYIYPCTNYKNIIYHEFNGHGYGRLADEYYTGKESVNISTDSTQLANLKKGQSNGGSLNVTLEPDPTKAPWVKFMSNKPKYERVKSVQGGYYFGLGVWRCEEFNCMIDNRAYFSAYCRYLQYKRIMETSGNTCSIESFMPIDKGADVDPGATTKSFVERLEEYPPLGEPVYIDYN